MGRFNVRNMVDASSRNALKDASIFSDFRILRSLLSNSTVFLVLFILELSTSDRCNKEKFAFHQDLLRLITLDLLANRTELKGLDNNKIEPKARWEDNKAVNTVLKFGNNNSIRTVFA